MTKYYHPPGVKKKKLGRRQLLSLPHSGSIALDPILISLWEFADGREKAEIKETFQSESSTPFGIQAALACLCEAGLLERTVDRPEKINHSSQGWISDPQSLISIIVVNFNSRDWLEECLPSLAEQALVQVEIIIIDNGSKEDPGPWLAEYDPSVIFRRLEDPQPLAAALNYGVELASGDYFMLLNPDTWLVSDALIRMLAVAESDPTCGVVAPLLKFSWAPAFS